MKLLKEFALFNKNDKSYDKGRYIFGKDVSGLILILKQFNVK